MTGIVVGVDGSEHSAIALRWAAREAELRGAELVAVLVWDLFNQRHADGTRRFDPHYDDSHADHALAAAVEAALGAEAAAGVARRTVCDVPAPGLLGAAKDAGLLVVGARGLGGFRGLLLGSVSQQCLHHAKVPIAIVRADDGTGRGAGRVVVGVDGSEASATALRWALAEGAARGAVVEAVHSWEMPVVYGPVAGSFPFDTTALEQGAHELVDKMVDDAEAAVATPVEVERTVVPGGPASSLLDAAKGADLVVVGRRGLGGFGRLLLGSVSDHVARHAPCPVVVMPCEEPEA
ncbi:MAG TPA: universal stress protein [Acidimicrobiales bacterium]|nr:universal stress protein [Acidimicrobiales bacterium]